ncbi:MAG: hypothetical protein R2867_04190 [Caldilineaceae bacterium]|nr:hypothetical protein [Caldilineaceae bacterium]
MITGIILSFFGASSLASIVVFAACVASGRADQIRQDAFVHFSQDSEQSAVGAGSQRVGNQQLTLNPS